MSSATIQVVVTDSFGASATATTTITVNNVAPTVQTFSDPFTTSESQSQNFGAGASFFDPATNDGPWIMTVDYGDGTPAQTLSYRRFCRKRTAHSRSAMSTRTTAPTR